VVGEIPEKDVLNSFVWGGEEEEGLDFLWKVEAERERTLAGDGRDNRRMNEISVI